MRWRLLACGAMLMLATGVSAAQGESRAEGGQTKDGATADEVRERARTVLADPVFQTELPGERGTATGSGGSSRGQAGRGRRRGPETPGEGRLPQRRQSMEPWQLPGGEVLTAFLWVVLAVVVIAALSSTIKEVRRDRRRRAATPEDEAEVHPAARPTARGLDEIEALARSGRYTEAVHLLLRHALERFGRRRRLDASLTSREILAGTGAGREALSILVETVERSWFGGSAVDREAYEECLSADQRLNANQRRAEES